LRRCASPNMDDGSSGQKETHVQGLEPVPAFRLARRAVSRPRRQGSAPRVLWPILNQGPERARDSAAGEPQNQRQDHTDQEPSSDREIEREVLMRTTISPGRRPSRSTPIHRHSRPTATRMSPRRMSVRDILGSQMLEEGPPLRIGMLPPFRHGLRWPTV
jgi:hypothetical protein